MRRELLLTSNGLPEQLKDTFTALLKKEPKDIKLSFITTAAYGEEEDPSWLDFYKKELNGYGITQIEDLDLKGKAREEMEKILDDKDIIYVNGGNTFYLLKYVRESGLDKLLPELLDRGKLYIGVSAGSIIATPDISNALWSDIGEYPDKNKIGLTDTKGLSYVPFLICPHILPEHLDTLKRRSKQVKDPVVGLSDKQAILAQNDKYEIVGEGEKIIYNNDKPKFNL